MSQQQQQQQQQPDQPVKATASMPFEGISFTSNGLPGGTKVLINGKEIADLSDLRISFTSGKYGYVTIDFSTCDETYKDGSFHEHRSYSMIPPKADASVTTPGQINQVGELEVRPAEKQPEGASIYAKI